MHQDDFNWRTLQVVLALVIAFLGRSYLRWHYRSTSQQHLPPRLVCALIGLTWRSSSLECSDVQEIKGDFGEQVEDPESVSKVTAPRRHGHSHNRKGRGTGPSDVNNNPAAAAAAAAARARELLEMLSSSSKSSGSDAGDEDLLSGGSSPCQEHHQPKAQWSVASPTADTSASTGQVRLMQDVRPGKETTDYTSESFGSLCENALLGISVWDVVSKKNRLRVTGCVRHHGDDREEALGLVIHRFQQHTLQVLYLGVAPSERRQGIGRALVRAVRDIARHEIRCLQILVLFRPSELHEGDHVVAFWRATGFRRTELKGLESGQVCLKIEVRKLGKHQRRQERNAGSAGGGGQAVSWDDILAEAKRTAAIKAGEAVRAIGLPPPPKSRNKADCSSREEGNGVPEHQTASSARTRDIWRVNFNDRPKQDTAEEEDEEEDEEDEEEVDEEDAEEDDEEEEEEAEEEQEDAENQEKQHTRKEKKVRDENENNIQEDNRWQTRDEEQQQEEQEENEEEEGEEEDEEDEEENEEQDEEEQEVQEEQTEEEGEKGEKQESLKQGLNEDLDHKKEGQMEDYDDDDYKDDDDENDDDKEEEDIDAYVKGAKFGLPAHKEVLAPRSSTTPIIPGSNRRPVPVRRSPTLVAGDGESAWRPTLRHLRPHTSNSRPH